MLAALRLRLLEARRRGGLVLLVLAALVVLAVGHAGAETVEGSYGLATDLAATFTYLAAVFFGALPLAVDRERRRAYLPAASPVAPWTWALGNAAGAALVTLVAGFVLFLAAGSGAALGGGVETYAVTRVGGSGNARLPVDIHDVPADVTHLRILPRVYVGPDRAVGTSDAAPISVNDRDVFVHANHPIVVPVRGPTVEIRNRSEEHVVGIARDEVRFLGERRPFWLNALLAGLAPALGAAALAAFGAAAGANLSAPVAALLTAVVLLLASLRGFLLEAVEHEGETHQVIEHGDHAHVVEDDAFRAAARALVVGILHAMPDLGALDHTGRAALGDWVGARSGRRALLILLGALLLAGALGGIGIHQRRQP
jgi:hypothetical protein